MKRPAAALLLLAAAPALAQPSQQQQPGRQPLIDIVRGSPATPGGAALLTLAEASLARAKAAAERGDTAAFERELRTIPGDRDSGAFIRALAAIAANAMLAAQSRIIAPVDAARIGDCAGGLADAADIPSPALERLEHGADGNGDGAAGWTADECGLDQLRRMIAQLAGAAGL